MIVQLNPEDERLIQGCLTNGTCTTPEEVIHLALGSFAADARWIEEHKTAIREQIKEGLAQLDRSEGMSESESLAYLETGKKAWRAQHTRE